jgi:hypothetical protein
MLFVGAPRSIELRVMGWLGISALVLMNAGLFVNLGYPKVAFVLMVIGAFGLVAGAVYIALRLFWREILLLATVLALCCVP